MLKPLVSRLQALEGARTTLVASIAYALFFAWFSFTGPSAPLANWDMLAYAGAAHSLTKPDDRVRALALDDVRRYVSPEQYRAITSSSVFRETVSRDDAAFLSQLWMYQLKPLYMVLTAAAGALLGNMALASVAISAAGFGLLGLALYLLRPRGPGRIVYLIAVIAILYLAHPQFTLLARAATPDSLAAALLLFGIHALMRERRRAAIAAAFFCLAVTARPDQLFVIVFLLPFLLQMHRDRLVGTREVVAVVALPVFTYALSKILGGDHGLTTVLYYAIFEPPPYSSALDASQVAGAYLPRLREDALFLLTLPRVILFAIASAALLALSRDRYATLIVFAAIASALAKILIFPHPDSGYQERYFFVSYFMLLLGVFRAAAAPATAAATRS